MKFYIKVNENNIITDYSVTKLKNMIEVNSDIYNNEINLCNYKYIDGQFIKLTEEEIQATKEENIQVTEEQQLLSTVLLENAEIKEQLKQQQELSATLALQIAELKGGNINV